MGQMYRWLLLLFTICQGLNVSQAGGSTSAGFTDQHSQAFIPNKGQLLQTNGQPARQVAYYYQGQKASVYFRENGWSYVFARKKPDSAAARADQPLSAIPKLTADKKPVEREYYRIDVNVVGANNKATIKGLQKTKPYYNYYLGHCPDGIEKVYSRKKLVYENIYPGTDLVFYFSNGKLKYDFKVKNGQDADQIKLRYQGAEGLEARLTNQLVVTTPMGSFKETIPAVYQETANGRQFYEGGYKAEENTVTFQTAQAIKGDGDLVIDPRLDWSTYFGTTGDERTLDIEVDIAQNVVICGIASTSNFPTTPGVFQTSYSFTRTSFISQFDNDGNLNWSTVYNGTNQAGFFNQGESLNDLATGPAGNIFLIGETSDTTFPISSNAFQDTLSNTNAFGIEDDAVFIELDSTGKRNYATFYGGTDGEDGNVVAVDSNQNVYMGGNTNSTTDFSVTSNGFDTSLTSSVGGSGFLIKFDSTWNRKWSTFYGDTSGGGAMDDIHITEQQKLIFCGGTVSSGDYVTTPNAYDTTFNGVRDIYVTKFNLKCQRIWGTLIGGSDQDFVDGIAANDSGEIFIIGSGGANYPITSNAYKSSRGGFGNEEVISKLDSSGKNLLYSTYFGGSNRDVLNDINIGSGEDVYIGGSSRSVDFPLTSDRYSDLPQQSTTIFQAPFVSILSDTGRLKWSSFIGSSSNESCLGIALDSTDNFFITGYTTGNKFPTTTNAYQDSLAGGYDNYITKVN